MTKLREFDQIELERLRRVRRSHEADRLTERELSRAVAQFGVRGSRRGPQRAARVVGLAAAASLLALGALAASNALSVHPFASETPRNDAVEGVQAEPGKRLRGIGAVKRPATATEPPREAPVPAAPPVASFAPLEEKPPSSAPRSQRALEVVNAEAAMDGAGRAWTRAAEALRRGDHSAAAQALGELSRNADPATRDAALLAQAELDLGTGSAARARAVLGGLAERGATPFVRARAQQILAEKN